MARKPQEPSRPRRRWNPATGQPSPISLSWTGAISIPGPRKESRAFPAPEQDADRHCEGQGTDCRSLLPSMEQPAMPSFPNLDELSVGTTRRSQLVDIGPKVQALVKAKGVEEGVVHLWSMHTTCALTVNENADPDVATDMVWKMDTLVPRDEASYRHAEGNSDSHVKTSLFGPGLTLLVSSGRLVLGRWQGVYLAEWDGPRRRTVCIRTVAEPGTGL